MDEVECKSMTAQATDYIQEKFILIICPVLPLPETVIHSCCLEVTLCKMVFKGTVAVFEITPLLSFPWGKKLDSLLLHFFILRQSTEIRGRPVLTCVFQSPGKRLLFGICALHPVLTSFESSWNFRRVCVHLRSVLHGIVSDNIRGFVWNDRRQKSSFINFSISFGIFFSIDWLLSEFEVISLSPSFKSTALREPYRIDHSGRYLTGCFLRRGDYRLPRLKREQMVRAWWQIFKIWTRQIWRPSTN